MNKLVGFSIMTLVVIFQFGQPCIANLCLFDSCGPTLGAFTYVCGLICNLGAFPNSQCMRDSAENNYAICSCSGNVNGNASVILGTACNALCSTVCLLCGLQGAGCTIPFTPENSMQCNCVPYE